MPNFDKNKSHEENLKITIDSILGGETTIKRTRRSELDHKRVLFVTFIEGLQRLQKREIELDREFSLDMYTYDSEFHMMIDLLLAMIFSKPQLDLLYFYLYDRVYPDGRCAQLQDDKGNIIDISTAEKFYDFLLTIKDHGKD